MCVEEVTLLLMAGPALHPPALLHYFMGQLFGPAKLA